MTSLNSKGSNSPSHETGENSKKSDSVNLIGGEHSPGLPKIQITSEGTLPQYDAKSYLQIPQRSRSKTSRNKHKKKHYGAVKNRIPKNKDYIYKTRKFKRYVKHISHISNFELRPGDVNSILQILFFTKAPLVLD